MDIQFIIKVVQSCKTHQQLQTSREWIQKLIRFHSLTRTNYNKALLMPVARATNAKEEELALMR
jgi:hypothetical protein